jgi:hypothetical protein
MRMKPKEDQGVAEMMLHPYPASPPWRDHRLTDARLPVPMLGKSETGVISWLIENYYIGEGEIVGAGCFLGGSTVATL